MRPLNATLMKILKSPWAILTGIVLGGVFGYFSKFGAYLGPPAKMYLGLLQMCILPIMITAIISSIGRLVKAHGSGRLLKRMTLVLLIGLLATSTLGVTGGLLLGPGRITDVKNQADLGRLLFEAENPGTERAPEKVRGAGDFFINLIPVNIFAALAEGHSLKILIFSILLGLAMGLIPLPVSDQFLDICDALCQSFKTIIGWLMTILPLGLFCIFADYISRVGASLFRALVGLILTVGLTALVVFLINHALLAWRLKRSFFQTFSALRNSYFVAVATSNSFVALPVALREMEENAGLDRQTLNLILPLGIVINRQGVVLVFAITIVFLVQLYNLSWTLPMLLISVCGAALTGMAALGRLGIASALLASILAPLGLPLEVAMISLLSLEVLFEPITSLLITQCNCVAAVFVRGDTGGLS